MWYKGRSIGGSKMALRQIFCPECGNKSQADIQNNFCFCTNCGTKIILNSSVSEERNEEFSDKRDEVASGMSENNSIDYLNKKLEEVAFYYKVSRERQEAVRYEEEPVYYLKAQDLLIDISEEYPEDYRIWWELCKPIDFEHPLAGNQAFENYQLNQMYFQKAVDKAELCDKQKLIELSDGYTQKKNKAKLQAEQQRMEVEQRDREAAEKKKEEERIREEQERQEKMIEQQKLRQQKEEIRQRGISLSEEVWRALSNKDYSLIDNSYFEVLVENNQRILGILKNVSNVMYLMAYRIDMNKGNTVYLDQTLSIKFDEHGYAMKFNNTPVRIYGMNPAQNVLFISNNGCGGLCVNGKDLCQDQKYISDIMKCAKKPLLQFKRIFM